MTSATFNPVTQAQYTKGVILVLIAGCFWSVAGLVIRLIDDANEWQILFYRSLALMFTLFFYIGIITPGPLINAYKRAGWISVLGGACLGVAYASWIFAMTHTTIANALFILASAPFITAAIARVVLKERVTKITMICMLIAMLGIGIMVVEGALGGTLLGNIFALGAATGFSIFTVVLRKSRQVDMTPAVFWSGVWGATVGLVMIVVSGDTFVISKHDFELCVLIGFVQVGLGLIIFTRGSRYVPSAELALLSMTEVILGPVWVWLGVGEVPSLFTLIGGVIVMAAITLQAYTGIRKQN